MLRLAPGLRLALGTALLLTVAACDAVGPVNELPPEPPVEPAALTTLLRENGDFETYLSIAANGSFNAGGGGTTILAPDDEAFALMSPETLAGLNRQPGTLARLLNRLVITTRVDLDALSDGDLLPTLEGTPIPVRVDDEGTIFFGEAQVEGLVGSTPDGPVLRISRVLRDHLTVRERLAASPLLSRSLSYFETAGIDLTQPGTYFIPINVGYEQAPGGVAAYTADANAALTRKTLRALVVPGEALTEANLRARGSVETVQGTDLAVSVDDGLTLLGQGEARILVADIPAGEARIHLIGQPLQGHLTLLERIDFLPQTASSAALVRRSGLAETLSGPGPYTVFAPTEEAFDSLGTRGRVAVLDEPDLNGLLARFHVSPGDVPASALVNGRDFPTLSDQTIRVRPDPVTGRLVIARSTPTARVDLPASNGRLHLMQSVLNPSLTPYDQLVLSGFGAFRAAVEIAGYRDLLESDQTLTIVGPATLSPQFLQPTFACRARELVEDHIATVPAQYTPMSEGFTTLSGRRVTFESDPLGFVLNNVIPPPGGGTQLLPIGQSRARYVNAPLANGGVLHASAMRLRWYGNGTHAENLPACP